MLMLTKAVGESLTIGDEIEVTILCVNGNKVKIGIEAPREIPVHREEIYKRIQQDKQHKKDENNE